MSKKQLCALVTGATRGIGFAIAERLLIDGYEVIVTGTSNNSSYPSGAIYHQVDFLNDSSLNDFVAFLKEQEIDILINNAGINKIAEFSSILVTDFDRILQVNLRAP